MKRTALILCLIAVLAFPALADALRRTYFGPAANGVNNAGVEISARIKHGKARKLTKFEWHNVIGTCSGRTSATTGEFPSDIAVDNGQFSETGHLNRGRLTITVSGEFTHHKTQMDGRLRVRGTVPGCPSIDTGVVKWDAKQPAGQK